MKAIGTKTFLIGIFAAALCSTALASTQTASEFGVLHLFNNQPSAYPEAGLVADASGNLYGTTGSGGNACYPSGCGTAFELKREAGGKWTYLVLHEFAGSDGQEPAASMIIDGSGNLYGTTYQGGAEGVGTVFELSPSANGWTEKVLYSFRATGDDVYSPAGPVVFDASGNLYGADAAGGGGALCGNGCGGVFKLTNSGGQWAEKIIYNFNGNSNGDGGPSSGLTWDSAGNLYGTMVYGGAVFKLSKSADGNWSESSIGPTVYRPEGGVILDHIGNLYGTTNSGGVSGCNGTACGTVFELANQGSGNWSFIVLYSFDGSNGGWPTAGLVSDAAGVLYGTAAFGGASGQGVVFKLQRNNGGTWVGSAIHNFNYQNGGVPVGALTFDHGILYGATQHDGANACGCGVVYALKP
jgi:uncharacterized repeat protein (TIGR03803 family)